MLDGLSDLFPHVVNVTRQTFDGWGKATAGASFTVPSYVYGEASRVTNGKGITVDSKYKMVTNGYFALSEADAFVLPAQFHVVSGACVAVEDHSDEDGAHHQTVYF